MSILAERVGARRPSPAHAEGGGLSCRRQAGTAYNEPPSEWITLREAYPKNARVGFFRSLSEGSGLRVLRKYCLADWVRTRGNRICRQLPRRFVG
jgi:hypothetical protein